MERVKQVFLIFMLAALLAGCGLKNLDKKNEKPLDFTVVQEADLPGEVKELVDNKKESPFHMTYQREGYLYLMQGYGQQSSGGYSVQVKKLTASEDAIFFTTQLQGPRGEEAKLGGYSCPWIVVKIPFHDLPVVFE